MKFKLILFLLTIFICSSCEKYSSNKSTTLNFKSEKKYRNIGFALLYNEIFDIKTLDERSLQIYHKNLKKNSLVKLTNPLNGKSLIAEVPQS